MKKILVALLFAFAAVFIYSCEKDDSTGKNSSSAFRLEYQITILPDDKYSGKSEEKFNMAKFGLENLLVLNDVDKIVPSADSLIKQLDVDKNIIGTITLYNGKKVVKKWELS